MKKPYLKKDKDHDVLGNKINPKKIILTEEVLKDFIKIVKIGDKAFAIPQFKAFQCAKCLFMHSILALPDDGKKVRTFYIPDDCHCNNKNKV